MQVLKGQEGTSFAAQIRDWKAKTPDIHKRPAILISLEESVHREIPIDIEK